MKFKKMIIRHLFVLPSIFVSMIKMDKISFSGIERNGVLSPIVSAGDLTYFNYCTYIFKKYIFSFILSQNVY